MLASFPGCVQFHTCARAHTHTHTRTRAGVVKEIAIMRTLQDHPNTVKLVEVFEDAESYMLVMELCTGGELFDQIIQKVRKCKMLTACVCVLGQREMISGTGFVFGSQKKLACLAYPARPPHTHETVPDGTGPPSILLPGTAGSRAGV
eukprot:1159491-Pelagomonas_calceolata.AAC.31